jgi:hypothetical protein
MGNWELSIAYTTSLFFGSMCVEKRRFDFHCACGQAYFSSLPGVDNTLGVTSRWSRDLLKSSRVLTEHLRNRLNFDLDKNFTTA